MWVEVETRLGSAATMACMFNVAVEARMFIPATADP